MPHRRSRWLDRIRAVGHEHLAARVSLDWLLEASPEEIHGVAEAGENEDPHRGAVYEASANLAATYYLRVFSTFEMAIKSYWRSIPGKAGRVDLIDAIDDVGLYLHVSNDLIERVQNIRLLRNDLVHDWNRRQVSTVDLPAGISQLIEFLDKLPLEWA